MRKGLIYAAIASLCGLFLLMRGCRDKQIDGQIQSPSLAPADSAKVIVDTRHHSIITITRRPDGSSETRATFLPPSGASVTVGKDSSVTVTARRWGTEIAPFLGLSLGSDIHLRAALGMNLFYIQRWELGGGLVGDNREARAFVHVSYNPYGSYFVSLGIDHKQTAHLTAGLKF